MKYDTNHILDLILETNPGIEQINFLIYPANIPLQERRKNSAQEIKQIERAIAIRNEFGFSFWESLMSTFINYDGSNYGLLSEALFHNKNKQFTSFSPCDKDLIQKFLCENGKSNVALSSTVQLHGKTMHLPLIDFHIPPSIQNQKTVETVIERLGLSDGILVNSGKSYHFISLNLINQDRLLDILIKMIFFAPIIDRNWIAHQLLEKHCALRVTRGNKESPVIVKIMRSA
ncbi:MAG: hypothetical protein KQH59_03535 [Desulfobulbaceae bacterium]|nr:hypothetical protein [Desulfobulbaceae bacterium]